MKLVIQGTLYMMLMAFIAYGIICYADICAHNLSGGSHAWWNLLIR